MKHERDFDPSYGTAVEILPGVRRLTAGNAGPFTFHGTNTYLIGTRRVVAVDPGPADEQHIATILKEVDGASLEAILVTHTHMDHSPGARLLKARTGAPIVGCGVHEAARELLDGEINPLDSSGDRDHQPDRQLQDGDIFKAADVTFETVATPGHTMNHLSFAIQEENALLSADHVMGWSTSIVAPPDGSMRHYMASLDKLLERAETVYLPGHGGLIRDAQAYVRDLKEHRLGRETAILSKLADGPRRIPEIVKDLYADVDPRLHPAAGLSVFAHLEDLASRGIVDAKPAIMLNAAFSLSR
ncbi:MBL fold metallo-hydrolase [Rhodobacterales bacterium]|nr:MBL fold metallo-hydrolase [Rhodobacterales bacterium]